MKRSEKALLCLASSLAFCAPASAVTAASALPAPPAAPAAVAAEDNTPGSGTPYQGIVVRNVFGLKPPPPPADPEANKPPPLKITLTGITSIMGSKRALLKTPPGPAKPGEKTSEHSYMLKIGEREDDIEVLDIDEKAGTVKVNNGGVVTTLDFTKDGAKPSSSPAPAPPPTGAIPPPLTPSASPYSHPAASGGTFTPGRPMRFPGAAGGATPNYGNGGYGATPATYGGGYGAPSMNVAGQTLNLGGYAGQPQNNPTPDDQSNLSLEQKVLLMKANQELHRQKGSPVANLFPPVSGVDAPTSGQGGQGQGTLPPLPQ